MVGSAAIQHDLHYIISLGHNHCNHFFLTRVIVYVSLEMGLAAGQHDRLELHTCIEFLCILFSLEGKSNALESSDDWKNV